MSAPIRILMATRNGEEHLDHQLDSIARQTHQNWTLLVADDGSSDGTLAVLQDFVEAHPGRLMLADFASPVKSPKANFLRLLGIAPQDSPYVAFCDQDDVWDEDKLALLLAAILELEDEHGPDTPCLAYSDLMVVDDRLGVLSDSFMAQIKSKPDSVTFGQLLLENSIPGCATLINGALLRLAQKHSGSLDGIIMHDWWLALIAAGSGRIAYVPRALVYYRQHERNAAGSVRRGSLRHIVRKVRDLSKSPYPRTLAQAKLLRDVYRSELSVRNAAILDAYCSFDTIGKAGKLRRCLQFGILKQSTLRRLQQLIAI